MAVGTGPVVTGNQFPCRTLVACLFGIRTGTNTDPDMQYTGTRTSLQKRNVSCRPTEQEMVRIARKHFGGEFRHQSEKRNPPPEFPLPKYPAPPPPVLHVGCSGLSCGSSSDKGLWADALVWHRCLVQGVGTVPGTDRGGGGALHRPLPPRQDPAVPQNLPKQNGRRCHRQWQRRSGERSTGASGPHCPKPPVKARPSDGPYHVLRADGEAGCEDQHVGAVGLQAADGVQIGRHRVDLLESDASGRLQPVHTGNTLWRLSTQLYRL